MTEVSEDRIEEIAEVVESDPSDVDADELAILLEGSIHSDFDVRSPAGDALEELVEELSESAITERFDVDLLRGRLTTEDVSAGNALSTVLETLAETNPAVIQELRPEIREGVGGYLKESTMKGVLCTVLDVETELVEEARILMAADNSTARNIGVRISTEVAGRGYDIDETSPDAVESALPDVWDVLKNSRENSKPRENAASALATHAEARPELYTDRMDEVAEVLQTTESKIRYDLFDLPQAIAEHDPDAVAPLAPVARREFEDKTGTGSTRSAAIELLSTLADTHPGVITSLDPFVERVEDPTIRYDDDAASVVAAVGGPEQVQALFGAGKFGPELIETLVEGSDDETRASVREEIRALVTDDDALTRRRAVAVIREVFHEELDDPAAIYLDRLDDDDTEGYSTVRSEAVTGLRRVVSESPDRLVGSSDRLFAAAEATIDADDYSFSDLIEVLSGLATADGEIYARVVDDIDADDEATRYVAIQVLSEAATAYPPELPDPVPRLLDLYGDTEDREYKLDGYIRTALGGLTYVRPDAIEPAADRLVEWYEGVDDTSGWRRTIADFASAYPEVPVALVEALAEDYVDDYTGEYSYDDKELAVGLGHAALQDPERVRSALDSVLNADADEQPESLPLVSIALGDDDAVPPEFAEEDGWLGGELLDPYNERRQLRLIGLVDAAGYAPAAPLLRAVVDDAAESELVAERAEDALERLS